MSSSSRVPNPSPAALVARALFCTGLGCGLAGSLGEAQQNEQQLVPSSPQQHLHFGWSADVEGDTAVIGAFGDQATDTPGAIYVYRRRDGEWTEQHSLRPSDNQDTLATSVALSGDTLLAGCYGGSAYVFGKTASGWAEQAILRVHGGLGAEHVSLDGDTAVVSASFDEIVGPHSGSAHVFVRQNGACTLQQRVIPRDSAGDDYAGPAAVHGDTLILAAPGKHLGRGAVYFFQRFGATWVQQQKLLADDGQSYDHFGRHVALDGDTALVSTDRAFLDNAVYVFRRDGARWKQVQELLPDPDNLGDLFGWSLAVAGDSLLVGSGNELFDHHSAGAGAAYLFERRGASWIRTQRLVASDQTGRRYFGLGVALSKETILVGAPTHERGGEEAGLVYAYDRAPEPVSYVNGRGINVDRLSADAPLLGRAWRATLDVVGPHRAGHAYLLLAEELRPGRLLQHGTAELFLDGALRAVLGPVPHAGLGDRALFSLQIPVIPQLLGSSWCAQGIVLGGPIGCTNAASGVVR